MADRSGIIIRSVESVEEMRALERLQLDVWQMGELEVVPARTMHAIAYNGGLLLGAYDGDALVGFIFAVIGTVQGLDTRVDQVAAARLQL